MMGAEDHADATLSTLRHRESSEQNVMLELLVPAADCAALARHRITDTGHKGGNGSDGCT